jgi:hypothetical protein
MPMISKPWREPLFQKPKANLLQEKMAFLPFYQSILQRIVFILQKIKSAILQKRNSRPHKTVCFLF